MKTFRQFLKENWENDIYGRIHHNASFAQLKAMTKSGKPYSPTRFVIDDQNKLHITNGDYIHYDMASNIKFVGYAKHRKGTFSYDVWVGDQAWDNSNLRLPMKRKTTSKIPWEKKFERHGFKRGKIEAF